MEYAEVNSDANVITILPGWTTSDLQADGYDRFNFNKQCVHLDKLEVKNVSFVLQDQIKIKLPKPVLNANYGLNCDLTYALEIPL